MSEEESTAEAVPGRKRNSIPFEAINSSITGIPQYNKASFLMVGYAGGVRLALPKTNGVSRAYFYGAGDYTLVPQHEAIVTFSKDERKAQHMGGIMARVDFDRGLEAATEALHLLIEVVRSAPPPPPRGEKKAKGPKAPREEPGERPGSED